MKIATAIATVLMLAAAPAYAGHGHGGNGGRASSASSHGKASKADRAQTKADRKAARDEARAERKAERAARKAAQQGPAVQTGTWGFTEHVSEADPANEGYQAGELDMNAKGRFSGWVYSNTPGEQLSVRGRISRKDQAVGGKAGDYKLSGHYTPATGDEGPGWDVIGGDLYGKGGTWTGTFDGAGPVHEQGP